MDETMKSLKPKLDADLKLHREELNIDIKLKDGKIADLEAKLSQACKDIERFKSQVSKGASNSY